MVTGMPLLRTEWIYHTLDNRGWAGYNKNITYTHMEKISQHPMCLIEVTIPYLKVTYYLDKLAPGS